MNVIGIDLSLTSTGIAAVVDETIVSETIVSKPDKADPTGAVRRERLCDITPADVVAEGFPDWTTAEFIAFFTAEMGGSYNQELTVIEWRYLPAKFYITNEERPRPIDPYTFGGAAAAGMARPRLARRGGA